jgi:8-oxo-dGTP pyrophosphatase MutT (NUDIX family)
MTNIKGDWQTSTPEGAIPASTLVIMRPGEDGKADDILLVKRASTMAFAPGAIVFPGGRVDPDDFVVARQHGFADGDVDGAARVAALRETLEETGLAVGWGGLYGPVLDEVRRSLLNGGLLSQILENRGERIDVGHLVPFARWCPNFKESRTFDTRFYAAQAPRDHAELSYEEAELSHLFWASAKDTLGMADRGELSVIFPTRRNLERLASAPSFPDFARHAADHPPKLITPWVEERDGRPHLCIPEGMGYPITSELFERAKRG